MGAEHISVKIMWENYLATLGENLENTDKSYTSWHFCSDEKSADGLAELALAGIKRGTTSLHEIYVINNEQIPVEGCYSVITNWNGIAQCIIRTKKVTVLPFKDVSEELANIEGEGDKSLRYWQEAHIEFFTEELKEFDMEFSPDMPVVFEEFEVVFR